MPKNLRPWLCYITDDAEGGGSGGEQSQGEQAQEPTRDQQNPGKGYPEGTPVAEMTAVEQAAYWKYQSRKHESRVQSMGDYADLKKKAAAFDKSRAEAQTEQEKAVQDAHEQGRQAALSEANEGAARAILTATLRARGKEDDDIAAALRPIAMSAFVTDGAVDHEALLAYADRLGGPIKQDPNPPDMGQGRRGAAGNTIRSGEELLKQYNL